MFEGDASETGAAFVLLCCGECAMQDGEERVSTLGAGNEALVNSAMRESRGLKSFVVWVFSWLLRYLLDGISSGASVLFGCAIASYSRLRILHYFEDLLRDIKTTLQKNSTKQLMLLSLSIFVLFLTSVLLMQLHMSPFRSSVNTFFTDNSDTFQNDENAENLKKIAARCML